MFTPKTLKVCLLGFILPAAAFGDGEASFIKNARQLTFEGLRSGEGYFSEDGRSLVFQSERDPENPFYQIYTLDFESGNTHRISPGFGKTTCGFFQPGTQRVLFCSTHEDSLARQKQKEELEFRASGQVRRYSWDYDPAYEIYSANRDGSGLSRLTQSEGYDAEAAFSPDGQWIVFSSTRGAYPLEKLSVEDRARFEKDPAFFADLYLMKADGSGVRRLTEVPGYDGGPFFSPDGKRIVWRRFDAGGMNADVFTMNTDGTGVQRVTDFGCMSWAPFYHPSGRYLIFTANKLGFGNFELFVVDVEGRHEPVRVTHTDGFDGLPAFSPDGRKLCWTSARGNEKKSQLYLADWDDAAALGLIEKSPLRTGTAADSGASDVRAGVAASGGGKDGEKTGAVYSAEIRAEDLKAAVTWLAAPEREGRRTGSRGAIEAGDWIVERLRLAGVEAGAGDAGFLQEFEYPAGVELVPGKNRLSVRADGGESEFELNRDFRPLSFSDSGEVEGEVVFAGYGLTVPEGNGARMYNSYAGVDVKDKVVLLLRYVPEGVEAGRRAQLNHYAGLRYKVMMARERGAKAVLVVAGPNSPHAGELMELSSDGTAADSGIVAQSITAGVAERLLSKSGKSLKELQSGLDDENPHALGAFGLDGVRVRLGAGVAHLKGKDRNVVGVVAPGTGGGTGEWVVVGGHYDHLGTGNSGSSMARYGEERAVHHGADDNASGTAVVMEVAAAVARERKLNPERFKRGVLFGFWSGEEMGLMGSAAFCENPPVSMKSCVAYVNFDMVGRLRENKVTLQGIGSSKSWRRLIERRNVAAGFDLVLQDDPYLPTDSTSFYPRKVPVLNFFTGSHQDYHRPSDTADKLEYEGMERIAKFAFNLVMDLVEAPQKPDFSRVEKSAQEGGSREMLRAYIGSIPDYSTEVTGVKLSGVRGGSPAEKGGLQGGDVIVEFGGQKIKNIYDYTYALDAVKIGVPVKVTVLRTGASVELEVTPEARK